MTHIACLCRVRAQAHKARLDATSLAAAEAVLEAEGHVASGPGESPVKNKQVKLPRKAEMEEVCPRSPPGEPGLCLITYIHPGFAILMARRLVVTAPQYC